MPIFKSEFWAVSVPKKSSFNYCGCAERGFLILFPLAALNIK